MSAVITNSPVSVEAVAVVAPTENRTEPLAAAGKARRRAQVLANLADASVVAEDAELLARHNAEVAAMLRPGSAWQDWVTGQVAVVMIRISRCARIERKLRDWAAYRAFDFWEDDQKLEVEKLALKLAKNPAKVVAQLRLSPAGCDWLSNRWQLLVGIDRQSWTADHQELARQLVGADPTINPFRFGFAAEQVAELTAQRRRVEEADAILRNLVQADLTDDGVPGLARLRRYARSLQRHLKWCLDHFDLASFKSPAAPAPTPLDPTSVPKSDETNPTTDVPDQPPGESKRVSPDPTFKSDETNPFERLLAELHQPELVGDRPPAFLPTRETTGPRHADPAREAARREKLARRRASLASMIGSC